ncbi:MAG: phosphoribosyl-ATP diphosphatase [Opitutales bacterium]
MAQDQTDILRELMSVIQDRKSNPSEKSYTASLFRKGLPKIGAKVLEEANEVVEAASEPGEEGRQHTIYEAADVIYHLFVLMANNDIRLEDVEQELAKRFGISGLEEKASRTQ